MRLAPLFALTGLLALPPAASADVFGPPVPSTLSASPSALTTGDLNSDGITDVVVGMNGGDIAILLGLPAGGLAAPVVVPSGGTAFSVAVGDFNADGDPDLATGHLAEVRIQLGEPGLSFAAPTSHGAGVGFVLDIAVTELNGDGDPDLVASDTDTLAPVLLGGAGGSFTLSQLNVGDNMQSVVAGDFDQDLDADVAFGTGTAGIALLPGNGDGTFGAVTHFAGPDARQLAVDDLNGDGDLDLVEGHAGGMSVRYGGPGAGFPTQVAIPVTGLAVSTATGDFNGDGDVDVVAGTNVGTLVVALGAAGNTFAPPSAIQLGSAITRGVVAHLNRDGRPDVAVTEAVSATASVLPNATVTRLAASPRTLAFGAQERGTLSAARNVVVSSTGERPLHVRAVRTTGDYVVVADGCSGETVPSGRTCTLAIRFAPQADGLRRASLRILGDAPTVDVALSGTGQPPPPATVRELLAAVFAVDRHSARAGGRLRLRYVSTMDALVTVELRRGRRLVRRLSMAAVAGRNVLTLRVPARRGRYRLTLTAVAGDQRVTDAARLRVRR
jgi:hypothetical protein